MPNQPCPACARPTPRTLDATNRIAYVNYYSCESCGHIWTTSRQTGEFLRHITPLGEKPPQMLLLRPMTDRREPEPN